jgi:hypothetical protein
LCAWPAPEDPCRPERRGCEGELSGSVGQSLAQHQQGKSTEDCRLHRQVDHRIDMVDQSLCMEPSVKIQTISSSVLWGIELNPSPDYP